MKTYNWEGVNPDGYFLDKLEPIPSALPSFQKLFQVSATALSIPRSEERFSRNAETDLVCRLLLEKKKGCINRAWRLAFLVLSGNNTIGLGFGTALDLVKGMRTSYLTGFLLVDIA